MVSGIWGIVLLFVWPFLDSIRLRLDENKSYSSEVVA
jgi:hypothetical protein